METDQRMSRISATTDFYLSRFGRTQIGIFQLPVSEQNPSWFYIFINSLMTSLRRNNFMPYNFWFRDISSSRIILIIWVSGYFRNDLREIFPLVKHFWDFHSSDSVSILGSFSISTESATEVQRHFYLTLDALLQTSRNTVSFWHQRTFGGSRFSQNRLENI